MCYYNRIKITSNKVIKLGDVEAKILDDNSVNKPVQNGFEYKNWPILTKENTGNGVSLTNAHWEFIPPWCNRWIEVIDSRKTYNTLNATGENLSTSILYREAAQQRRCLVLSSGFYEWRHHYHNGKSKANKYPYYINVENNGKEYFFMAGIWQQWTDRSTNESVNSFAILTTKANHLMEKVHNTKKRMPVILPEEIALEWLLGDLDEKRLFSLSTYQINPDKMKAYSIKKEFLELEDPTESFDYPDLPNIID